MHPAPNATKLQQKFRTTLLASSFVLVLGFTTSKVSAFAPIGDDASLFATAVVTAAENDNIFLSSSNAKSSAVVDFIPGLSFEYGSTGALDKGAVQAYEDFQLFSTYSSINNQLFNFVFWNKYEDANTKLSFDASFNQIDQPERDIHLNGFLVNRNVYHIDGTDEERIDEKSSASAGIIFDDTDYKTPGYVDISSVTIPVNYYVAVDPKLDFSTGVRYRINTLENGDDSRDVYVNLGLRGEFTPDLTGEVDVGYNHQSIDIGSGTSGLGADLSLNYAVTPKTNVKLGLSDDFAYGSDGSPIRVLSTSLGFNSAINEQWIVDATGTFGFYDYLYNGRQDDFYTIQAGVTYVFSTNLKLRAGYTLFDDQSNIGGDSFTDDIFSITASLRF